MKAATMLHAQTPETTRTTDAADAAARTQRIRELNDAFRNNPFRGPNKFMLTRAVVDLSDADRRAVVDKMRTFNIFTDHNDPHGEHDFGRFTHKGEEYFWKFDYYAVDMVHGSPDPADPEVTVRVLTLMLASDY